MKKVTVSVPGKIHLMGEHAVVYGKPALLTAINLRLTVSIEPAKKFEIISTEPIGHTLHAVDYLFDQFKIEKNSPIKITIDSHIPAGFHLGSSAAVAVALTGAVMYFFKKLWNPMRINELAYEIEKKQHGNPSGGDNTVVTMGGFIWYRKELEFLKSIWQLPFKPHASVDHFFLVNTGKPSETTGEMVAMVKAFGERDPYRMQQLLDVNETQVKWITAALKIGDEPRLITAMKTGEQTLEGMGVVSETVQSHIRAIEHAGGAAKILGGGGKKGSVGFLLCYHHDQSVIKKLLPSNYTIQQVVLGEEGIRLEQK